MSNNLEFALKLSVDKKVGESNVNAFRRAFKEAMLDIGKTAADVDAFSALVADINRGKKSIDELDAETKQLYRTYREGAQLAADRDILGVRAHAEIQKEMAETREAYQRLKKTGKLTQEELAQAALKTEERIRELKHQTNGWTDALGGAAGSIAGLAASATGLATMAGYAIDFESAMADVRKATDAADDELESLGEQLKTLTAELPYTAQGLAAIAAEGGRLGVPIEQLGEFVTLAAKIGTAFDLSAEQSGAAIAKLSNLFDIPLDQVEQLGDAINVLGNTTAAREADILNVLTRIAGTANQFDLTAQQAAALAATMIEMGATSEVAATGINALLVKLQTANVQSPDFRANLERIGISATQLAEDIRNNPQAALTDFLQTLERLDDQSRAEVLTKLFGQEYQDDIARLINGLDNYQKSLDNVTQSSRTAGAMQREFAARMETTEAQIQLMQNGLQEVAINLGSVFLPAIREVVMAVGDVSRALADFVDANPAIAAIATSLGTVAISAGALRLLFLSLGVVGSKAFGNIRKEIALANTDLRLISTQAGKTAAAMRIAGGIASAAWIGWDIGTQLREEFVEVERAGIALSAGLTKIAERIRFVFDVIETREWDASLERLETRLRNVDKIYGDMFAQTYQPKQRVDDLTNSLDVLADRSESTAQKLRDEFAKIDLTSESGISELTKQIDAAGDSASVLGAEIEKWVESANTADLSQFQARIQAAFEAGELSAQQLADYNNQVLRASFDSLGVVAESAIGRISDESQNAIDSIDLIRVTLNALSTDAATSMAGLEAAVSGAIAQADTLAALDAIRAKMDDMTAASALSDQQMQRLTRTLDEQRNTILSVTPGIQGVTDAMRTLGLTSQTELQKSAAAALAVVNQLREMKAPIEDQKTAFIEYAKRAVLANEQVGAAQRDSAIQQLRVIAVTLNLSDVLEQILQQQGLVGDSGKQMGDDVKRGAEQGTKSIKKMNESVRDTDRDVRAVAASLSEWFVTVRDELYSLSEQTGQLFDNKLGIDSTGPVTEIESIEQSISHLREQVRDLTEDNLRMFDGTGLTQWANNVASTSAQVKTAYYEQRLELLNYYQALNSGDDVSRQFIRNAETAIGTMNLLGQQDLAGLRSALDSATAKLDRMNESARNTLSNLQDELDRLEGRTDDIQQRDYERKKAELQQQLDAARLAGNKEAISELTEALRVLDKIRKAQNASARASISNDRNNQNAEPAPGALSAPAPQSVSNKPARRIDISIQGETPTSVNVASDADADALTSLLEQIAEAKLLAGD